MDEKRLKDILFCTLELLRAELQDNFYDRKDCDDFIFSELDMEVSEILEIYDGSKLNIYTGSAFADGTSPKNWADLRRQLGESKAIEIGLGHSNLRNEWQGMPRRKKTEW